MMHRDGNNMHGIRNWVVAFGPYGGRGGRIWVQDDSGNEDPPPSLVKPKEAPEHLKGIFLQPYHAWCSFDPHKWH
eukprot:2434862-Amphidinium_carterae.1